MKPAAAFITGASSVAVIAVGLQVGLGGLIHDATTASATTSSSTATASSTASATPTPTATATATSAPSADASSKSGASQSSSSNSNSNSNASTGITGTFHGTDIAEPEFGGDTQVDVVFVNGKITAVNTISCNATHGASNACYQLPAEVISAQSANVSTISRATYTSQAYLASVQSALDAAGFTG